MYQHLLEHFNGHLKNYLLQIKNGRPAELYEPEAYILSLGGKRVRPLLALVACELMGEDPVRALSCAMAVELFHNFSLIHDDILDAAPLRRGQPTVHYRYGNNVAILSGDVMLVKALAALQAYPDAQHRQLSGLLQQTAIEVCEGQQMDMNFETRKEVTVPEYIEMISFKTAVLLGCSLRMGAVCAGASAENQKHLYGFGKHLGIAFQLLDDLLDCYPAGDAFGKKTGGDIVSNKKTFLWLKALELGDDKIKKRLGALSSAKDNDDHKIEQVLGIFSELKVDALCKAEADRHTGAAIGLLEKINCDPEKKKQLEHFALDLLQRQS